jgi:hypothetical protein
MIEHSLEASVPLTIPLLVLLLMALPALHGCSKQPITATPPTTTDAQAQAAQAAASEPQQTAKACELVTDKEMTAILGAAVHAEPDDRSNGKTECIYTPVAGVSPYVEFSVEWGSGEGAMMGAGKAKGIFETAKARM